MIIVIIFFRSNRDCMCVRFHDPDETENENCLWKLEGKMRKFSFEPRLDELRENDDVKTKRRLISAAREIERKTLSWNVDTYFGFRKTRNSCWVHFMKLNFFITGIKFYNL